MAKTILVVDDHDHGLSPLVEALERSGYDAVVVLAEDDPVARFNIATPELVFLSLLDSEAIRYCERIRNDPDGAIVPIIFIGTGRETVRTPSDALTQGGDYFFAMPLDLTKVLSKVQTYVGPGTPGAQKSASPKSVVAPSPKAVAPPTPQPLASAEVTPVAGNIPNWPPALHTDPIEELAEHEPDTAVTALVHVPRLRRDTDPSSAVPDLPVLPDFDHRSGADADQALTAASDSLLAEISEQEGADQELERLEAERQAEEEILRLREAEELALRQAKEKSKREAEELAKQQAEAEIKRLREAEAEKQAEAEIREILAEKARLREQEARRQAEEQARLKAEEEARLKAEEEARLKAEEDARLKAEEDARLKAEEDARLKAEEEARLKAEEEARRKAEEEARRKAEEEARRKAEEEARRKAEEEARRKAEEEARRKAEEEARFKAEQEARRKVEEEARRKVEEEARRKAEEEAQRKAEEEAQRKAEEEARQKVVEEAQRQAEEEDRRRVETEIRRRVEAELKLKKRTSSELKILPAGAASVLPMSEAPADPEPYAEPVVISPPPRPTSLAPLKALEPQSGTFSGTDDIACLMFDVFRQQVTGRLDFASESRRKTIFVERGGAVEAYSSQIFDRMEEYLYRHGKITRAQYQDVRVKNLRNPRKIGAHLVAEGALKPQELFEAVRGHLQDVVCGVFEWEEGEFRYQPERVEEDDRVTLDIEPPALIVEAIRRKYLMPRLFGLLGTPSSLLATRAEAAIELSSFGFNADERQVLRFLDGTRSIEDLVFSTGLPALRVYHVLTALVAAGNAEVRVRGVEGLSSDGTAAGDEIDRQRIREKLEQVRQLDYFQILGVPPTATSYEVEQAFDRVAHDFQQARFSESLRRDLGEEIQEIERVIEDARQVLRDDTVRAAYARNIR